MDGVEQSTALNRDCVARFTRQQVSLLLQRLSREINASGYLLAEVEFVRGRESVRIVSSNWIYDAVEELGPQCLAKIASGAGAHPLGIAPRAAVPCELEGIRAEQATLLEYHGHRELYCHRIGCGGRRVVVIFSSAYVNEISAARLPCALVELSYAFGSYRGGARGDGKQETLSERERECLMWVSQGKTAEEVAVILGVSGNTVNSYVSHAIKKFGASNRAMAIATAIRTGII